MSEWAMAESDKDGIIYSITRRILDKRKPPTTIHGRLIPVNSGLINSIPVDCILLGRNFRAEDIGYRLEDGG